MAYQIPQFLMGQTVGADFSPFTNALGAYRDAQKFNAQNALARDKLAEEQRQFGLQNALASRQFGLAARSADRQDQMFPLQMKQLEVTIEQARRQGATDAQLAPLRMQHMQATTELAQAQARAAGQKDEVNGAIAGMLRGALPQPGAAPGPTLQPQSFGGGGMPMQPQPIADEAISDPALIRTQAAPQAPQQSPVVDTPLGRMPMDQAQKLGFALGLAGKGDAGKLLMDAANSDKLDKTAKGEVEKDMVGLVGTIGRLESIEKKFDPKFLEIPNRAGMAWGALVDKFGALPDDQKADLTRYTKFRQVAVQNAALYVKYLSGVAVSEQEFARISKTLPNAGTGIADGDSPTEFQAKMKESVSQAKMAYARAHYLTQKGFKGKPWEAGIAIDDVRDLVEQRGAQIERELRGRVLPERMNSVVRQKLKQEFGI